MTADESIAALKELLTCEIRGLRELIAKNDALYTERAASGKTAVDAALAAAKTLNDATFAASEKAIGKSDQNAEKWRENANEWRSAMMDREIKFASRTETENEFKNLRAELAGLKEYRASGAGAHQQQSDNRAWLAAAVSVILLMMAVATFFLKSSSASPPAPSVPQVIYVPAPAGALLPTTPPQPAPR